MALLGNVDHIALHGLVAPNELRAFDVGGGWLEILEVHGELLKKEVNQRPLLAD